ncbi:hypothetical protein PA25_19260 [Pseudoalteromonas sp. A25]|uniref:hypothetical protein n=1 Tax=Pseudoalteromonas sp. A25 TaxID=116092 RepID=UPI001260B9D4|nr:hypothetical protein [Pseudoalteromonas sp. A25]BBN81941.1 hypothetical protein PA25_19260 [Pseudoalteromonas sp. A25]
MSIDSKLTKINAIVTEQTNEVSNLKTAIEDSWQEIDKVHQLAKQNHQAARDWQTKAGKVTFKDLNDTEYQVDTLATLINETQKINPHPEVMTKAQFDALRQMRKQQYAGSGFVQWGYGDSTNNAVNNGMWTYQNKLNLGRSGKASGWVGQDKSSSPFPKVVVDGVSHELQSVDYPYGIVSCKFPSAPDGTKTYDSATGKVTQHTSTVEAFNECKHKTPNGVYSGVYNKELGEFNCNDTGPGGIYLINKTSAGAHKVSIVFTSSIDTTIELRDAGGTSGTDPLIKQLSISANTKQKVVFTHTFTKSGVYFRVPEPQVGQKITIYSWQTLPSSEQVITSRKDLVFLESWHEKIADKDVVYPLGNVQYGASSHEGIALANNLVAQGYSAFGEWDQDTKGYGVKWSTLSDANRIKFLKNPEHNIYYDPEAKAYIQVRYRVRVVEGLGDEFDYTYPGHVATSWRPSISSNTPYFNARGKNITAVDYYSESLGYGYFNPLNNVQRTIKTKGDFEGFGSRKLLGHDSKCFAIPIALVQRLNQGAYHPTYNPLGTKCVLTENEAGQNLWYGSNSKKLFCQLDAFTQVKPYGGKLGDPDSQNGRRDQYRFYDAIYAGQVEDLRLNANKLDVNQLREDAMRKAVAGTLRGKGKTIFTTVKAKKLAIASAYAGKYYVNLFGTVDTQNGYEIEPQNRPFSYLYNSTRGSILYPTYVEPSGNIYTSDVPVSLSGNRFQDIGPSTLLDWQVGDDIYLINGEQMTSEFDSLPWVDIIGHPERIAATFPDGVLGQWIPQLPDGTSKAYELNKKANRALTWALTTDYGENWSAGTLSIDAIKNAYTSSAEETRVQLLSYEALADFTLPANNMVVKSSVGSVFASADRFVTQGNRLISSLSGLIGKDSQDGNQQRDLAVLNAPKHAGGFLWNSNKVSHSPITLREPINQSCGAKALPTIVEKGGLLYLQFHGAELKWDNTEFIVINSANVNDDFVDGRFYWVHPEVGGALAGKFLRCVKPGNEPFSSLNWAHTENGYSYRTIANNIFFVDAPWGISSWGDDQTIPIVNGEDVKTDLNGNTVKVFCHHTQLPLGIASY